MMSSPGPPLRSSGPPPPRRMSVPCPPRPMTGLVMALDTSTSSFPTPMSARMVSKLDSGKVSEGLLPSAGNHLTRTFPASRMTSKFSATSPSLSKRSSAFGPAWRMSWRSSTRAMRVRSWHEIVSSQRVLPSLNDSLKTVMPRTLALPEKDKCHDPFVLNWNMHRKEDAWGRPKGAL